MWHRKSLENNQCGMVLISTLLFIFVLTLIVMSAVERQVMSGKMSANYYNGIVAFNMAEDKLIAVEHSFKNNDIVNVSHDVSIREVGHDNCVETYVINARAIFRGARARLEEGIQVPHTPVLQPCKLRRIMARRLWWREE